jgi:Ca2+/Na+ antiporter
MIPQDVAGATFLAFGSSAPEIIIAAITTFQQVVTYQTKKTKDVNNLKS